MVTPSGQFLIDEIVEYCKFDSTFSIKNSYVLIEKIKDITLPNSKLISFDDLFPIITYLIPIIRNIENIIENTLSVNNTHVTLKMY